MAVQENDQKRPLKVPHSGTMFESIPLSAEIAVDAEHCEKQTHTEYQASPYPEWKLNPLGFGETCDGQAGHRRAAD